MAPAVRPVVLVVNGAAATLQKTMGIVTRYAPSPTGDLHIGGARTALFNWALARCHGGQFLLRFEDTDRARSTRESEAAVLEAFEWLGLDYDPVPGFDQIPRQSERMARYAELVAPLVAAGAAYRCTCTSEEVNQMRNRAREAGQPHTGYDGSCREKDIGPDPGRPFCVRLRVDLDGPTRWQDLVAGPSGQDAEQIEDFVLLRTDGSPIYHVAVVVDDHDMGVTHVIRGREHILSTSRQLLLYRAFGFDAPEFAHVPLLVDTSGKKLSKRAESVSVQSYRDRGFTPEAVLNYIARLGWGHGDLEIVSKDELAKIFALSDVGSSPSQVHEDKLLWLSQHYLRELPAATLHAYVQPFLESVRGGPVEINASLAELLELLRPRAETLIDMAERAGFALSQEIEIEEKAARKHLKPEAREPLEKLRTELAGLGNWSAESVQPAFEAVCATLELKMGNLAQPTRVAVTGSSSSPGIYETLAVLGQQRTLERLDAALARLPAAD